MRERLRVLRAVPRSPVLRRLEAAFLAFSIGERATWVAVVIYAYGRGGATEAGVVAFVQLVPSIVIAPIAGNLGDRFPRARVLTATYVVQGVAMAATSIALAVAASPLIVYGLCTLVATSVTLTRPTQGVAAPGGRRDAGRVDCRERRLGVRRGGGHVLWDRSSPVSS